MADNQDYKDFEHMTGKDGIKDDIDVIFDSEDNRKVIIPSKDELKDFPEERLNDDYISDEDLDFVDSIIEEDEARERENETDINLYEQEESKNDIKTDLSSDTDELKIPDLDDVKLDFDSVDSKHLFSDKLVNLDDVKLDITDDSSPETEIITSETQEKPVDETIIIPSNEEIKSNEEQEENEVSELNSSDEEKDRIEIVVKDINQEVISPDVEETKEEEQTEEKPLQDLETEESEVEDVSTADDLTNEAKEINPETEETESETDDINSEDEEWISLEELAKIKDEETDATALEEVQSTEPEEDEVISIDELAETKTEEAVVSDELSKENQDSEPEEDLENSDNQVEKTKDTDESSKEINDVQSENSDELSFDDIDEIKPDDILIGNDISAEIKPENHDKGVIYLNNGPDDYVQFLDSSEKTPVSGDKVINLNALYSNTHSDEYKIVEEEDTQSGSGHNKEDDDNILLTFEEDNNYTSDNEITEEKENKTEEDELLEENVFAVCNIDSKKGFYLGKSENGYALYGYINDEIIMLKEFSELYNKSLGIRLEERTKQSSSYLVRVNRARLLVNVTKESMSVALEL